MVNKYTCDALTIHEDVIKDVQAQIINENMSEKLSKFFKAIADPTRMKILYALRFNELCVCDISIILNMNQSAISHQLKTLKENNLVKSRKDGKTRFYQLADQHVHDLFALSLTHLLEDHHEKDL
jgi:ArsR family transcriptional regulator